MLLLVGDDNISHNWERKEGIAGACEETRKVAAEEVFSALSVIKKAKIDPSGFLETLGGKESPGRTWMLIFTAEKQYKGGRYFPLTVVQRFDTANLQSKLVMKIFQFPKGSSKQMLPQSVYE